MLIAVDWGTTNLRAYRLDDAGHILESRSAPKGVAVASDFEETLKTVLADWWSPSVFIIMCGMIGSTRGWAEVPYQACPVSRADLSQHLYAVKKNIFIVPGVSMHSSQHLDVMRGEETQIFGAARDGLFCLPGTHSKWASVQDQRIVDFSTYMSGELFKVISTDTILAMPGVPQIKNAEAFLQGVQQAQKEAALSALLFTARSSMLFKLLAKEHVHSYLSGLLIGSELKYALRSVHEKIYIVAEDSLAHLYEQALTHLNREAKVLNAEEITVQGLFKIAKESVG